MRIERARTRPSWKGAHVVALALIAGGIVSVAPASARASEADCTAAMKAATLQSKTPFHATYTVTPTTPGAFPIEHHEETWVGNTMYTLLNDGRWMSVPNSRDPMGGFTGSISGFSDCRSLPSASIRGEVAPGYDVMMEKRRRVKIWISPKSGLPVREVVDQDILLVTLDFDYANVHAPR